MSSITSPGGPGAPLDAGPTLGPARGRALVLFGALLGPLLAGYLLFDRAFAYLRLPGTPVFVGELVLGVGLLGALTATGYVRLVLRDEPVLALLAAFMLWGLVGLVAGIGRHGTDALRDSALWYYGLLAVLVAAALVRSPELLDRLVLGLGRLLPWLLLWLPLALILSGSQVPGLTMPWSTVSVFSHKPGSVVNAAVLGLAHLWLFPRLRSAPGRAVWTALALVAIALAATQNRGGMLGAVAGIAVGAAFFADRWRLIARTLLVVTVALILAVLFEVRIPMTGVQGREYSTSQLVANLASLAGAQPPGNLGGTVDGRKELWSRVLDKQVADGRLVEGAGFGSNLAAEVGVYDDGKDSLRGPHNSHLDVLARMGLVGFGLWIAFWVGWYRRLVAGCRRLDRDGLHRHRQVAVGCLAVTTAILVASVFDPQLEGPQVAALLWTLVGIGVAVTR